MNSVGPRDGGQPEAPVDAQVRLWAPGRPGQAGCW